MKTCDICGRPFNKHKEDSRGFRFCDHPYGPRYYHMEPLQRIGMSKALDSVRAERFRQEAKWGDQKHSPREWLPILAEEFGEVAKEICDGSVGLGYRRELTHLAAVATKMIECFDAGRLEDQHTPPTLAIATRVQDYISKNITEDGEWVGTEQGVMDAVLGKLEA